MSEPSRGSNVPGELPQHRFGPPDSVWCPVRRPEDPNVAGSIHRGIAAGSGDQPCPPRSPRGQNFPRLTSHHAPVPGVFPLPPPPPPPASGHRPPLPKRTVLSVPHHHPKPV